MKVEFIQHPARAQLPQDVEPYKRWTLPDGAAWTLFYKSGGDYLVRFPQFADFHISQDGARVEAWSSPGVPDSTAEHFYLNQVFPLALSRQGELVLHASAVRVGDSCVAFMGSSGRGKSTLAAFFASHGQAFLTDDGLHLQRVGDSLMVQPSNPSIRLWSDSRQALTRGVVSLAPALEFTSKQRLLAGGEFTFWRTPLPLQRIYHLGDGKVQQISITSVDPPTAHRELMRNSFLLEVDEHALLASHFSRLVDLAGMPLHFDLDFPRTFDNLHAVRQAVLHHASQRDAP